jgi:thiol-disulfide isomerase/thioredoxin
MSSILAAAAIVTCTVSWSAYAWGPTFFARTGPTPGALLQAATRARVTVQFFVTSDCPISNFYAPEIQQLCAAYAGKGVRCALVYEDVGIDDAGVRRHLAEYRYEGFPTVIDRDRTMAAQARASVTPQAVVIDSNGEIRYRGRIDNRYEAFGRPRRVVTERDLRDALDAVLAGRAVSRRETTAIGCSITSPKALRKQP